MGIQKIVTWNYMTQYKLFILRIFTSTCNCLKLIYIISYLKPFIFLPKKDWLRHWTNKQESTYGKTNQPTNQPTKIHIENTFQLLSYPI